MAIKYLNNIDLNKNELQNAVVQVLASAPSSPAEGQVYYDSTDDVVKYYDGAAWQSMGGDITGITTATANQVSIINPDGPVPHIDNTPGAVENGATSLAT